MKIRISFEVDTPQEAKEVLLAVEKLAGLPYKLGGYGTSIMKETPPTKLEVDEPVEAVPPKEVPPPPGEACSKIGTKTVEHILETLKHSSINPDHPKWVKIQPQLKLMFNRKLIYWNGTNYVRSEI